jgi:dephospho-CoA kinase
VGVTLKKINKIIVIGKTGSGKTTVADILCREFGLPVYYMDRLFLIRSGSGSQRKKALESWRKSAVGINGCLTAWGLILRLII